MVKKGVLITTSLKKPAPKADVLIAAVRTFPDRRRLREGWIWDEQARLLAPSPDLWRKTQVWKRQGEWPARFPEFREQYLLELMEGERARIFNLLVRALHRGKTIAVACWCLPEPGRIHPKLGLCCHRTALADAVEAVTSRKFVEIIRLHEQP